jgi:pyrroline-5-carboxylate reductase
MGGAILAGLLDSGATVDGIIVTNRSEERAAPLRSALVTSFAAATDPDANRRAVADARIVVIAVKPAIVPDVLREISTSLPPDALVVSVAAGVTIATMEALTTRPVFRAAPNTPSIVRRGVTGLAASTRASAADTAVIVALFETVGTVIEVAEEQMNALSSISASGPAYVYFLIERLTESAKSLGFDDAEAKLMVQQTFLGASEWLAASESTPAELRRQVRTPDGSTASALERLASADLTAMFDRATAAAIARAEEMGREA